MKNSNLEFISELVASQLEPGQEFILVLTDNNKVNLATSLQPEYTNATLAEVVAQYLKGNLIEL